MSTPKILPKTQQALLNDIRAGEVVHYIGGINACFFRAAGLKPCNAAALALENKGLVRRVNKTVAGATLALTEAGIAASQPPGAATPKESGNV